VMKTGGPAFAQPTAANKHTKAAAFISNSNRSGAIPQTARKERRKASDYSAVGK
jgi:hypothetical protein